MNDIQKFYTDIQKILKRDRADNAGVYNAKRACGAVADFFRNNTRDMAELPSSIADYWLSKVALVPDAESDELPSQDALDWLCDAQELLDGTLGADTHFSADDWQELREMINCEAEDLPIELLTSLMGTIMDHGAL